MDLIALEINRKLSLSDSHSASGVEKGTYFGLNAKDGDTFFNLLRVTTALHLTYIFRSRGVVIKLHPIVPGVVRDGRVVGHDLQLQASTTSLSANWDDFRMPHSSGAANENSEEAWEPKIEYYEVAVGTDPNHHLDNVVPFTSVGLNTSVTFQNLDLRSNTSKYYVTVKALSKFFNPAQATSNGVEIGAETNITGITISRKTLDNFNVSYARDFHS